MESSTPPSQLPIKTSYRGITSDRMVLTKTAMNELRTHLSFTQLRFHCSKKNGRTFHVTTVADSTGEAVVQYFSGQTNDRPPSCGSYVRMENDNSYLGGNCKKWKKEKWSMHSGMGEGRLNKPVTFSDGTRRWRLRPSAVSDCDDHFVGVTAGDFWKIYVR